MNRARVFTSLIVAALVAAAGLGASLAGQAAPQVAPADLVIRNGRIITLDDGMPVAQALAARNGAVVFIGSNADVAKFVAPATRVINLLGQTAIPGFIEGHGHFTGIGENKINLDLMATKSWDEIVHQVALAVERAKPGQWIVGRGWHQEKWSSTPQPNVEGFPTHTSLDKVSPNNPVILTHASGHASFANAKALELSKVTKDTANPEGGEILKDKSGEPTGLLRETASRLIRRGAGEPTPTPAEAETKNRKILELADQEVISKGITSFQDAGSSFDVITRVRRMIDAGKMHVRLWMMAREYDAKALAANRVVGYGNNMLTLRAIKITGDGALGSRGAWLLEPYSDLPEGSVPAGTSRTGLATTPVETMRQRAQIAIDTGYQMCIHAIGDRANREVLNVYEEAFKKNNKNGKDLRWRVEHAQHINGADIPRFGQLGVIAAMQGIHCTSDAPWVEPRLGAKRAEEGAYVWQKLMKSGAVVTNGTDAPVEDVDPIASYYATVTRKAKDGKVFYGDQKMSRMEALKSYTLANAFAAFEEDLKGSLSLGKLADITVLTKDITTVPDEEILTAKVSYTIVGGKVVYTRPAPPVRK
ncbi:MAG TPA: amidohydrolase [Vicinamibacterales bacterium]|nr:amidohydrolase [Vicinamibacterales bacterium]